VPASDARADVVERLHAERARFTPRRENRLPLRRSASGVGLDRDFGVGFDSNATARRRGAGSVARRPGPGVPPPKRPFRPRPASGRGDPRPSAARYGSRAPGASGRETKSQMAPRRRTGCAGKCRGRAVNPAPTTDPCDRFAGRGSPLPKGFRHP
jgi:hypothetical protein